MGAEEVLNPGRAGLPAPQDEEDSHLLWSGHVGGRVVHVGDLEAQEAGD